ncbi:hypothetical protein [Cupriavidus sp. D384]|uniref:hypothetical protein n=1 Tax=Cupriavidus sp. D384 TaxID=1538095 RepID=UPI00082BFE26|nr:hypothetical protein [Cupriavidus sp. D384]
MRDFLASIRQSLETNNFYVALATSLTIPDICGWLSSPNLRSGERYRAWCETYLTPKYTHDLPNGREVFLSPGDAYALRCAYLHEGADDVSRQRAREALNRFAFVARGAHCNLFEINGEAILNLNVPLFCTDMVESAEQWLEDVRDNQAVQERLREFLKIRSEEFELAPGVFMDFRPD